MAIDFTSVNSSPVRHLKTPFSGLGIAADQDFSILAYARFEENTNSLWYFLSSGPASGTNINLWRQGPGDGRLSALVNGAITTTTSGDSQAINNGESFLASFSRRNGLASLRLCKIGSGKVDGWINLSNTLAYTASASDLFFGARQDLNTGREWHGQMSDVIICHDYGLTEAESIAAANGAVLDQLPFWQYRKFHTDMSFDPSTSAGLSDLVSGRAITAVNSGWGAKTDDPALLRRYSQLLIVPRLFYVPVGGGDTLLTVNDISQSQSVDNLSLTQANVLAVADTAQSQLIENIDLVQANTLSVAESAQSQSVDNITLTQSGLLSVADSSQAQTSDNIALTQQHTLSIADISQSQSIDNITLSSSVILTLQDIGQSQLSDNIDLIQQNVLAIQDINQSQIVDNITLASGILLVLADSSQSQTSDNISLVQANVLSVADSAQSQTIDAVALIQSHILTVADSSQSQSIDNIALSLSVVLNPGDLTQNQSIDGITLTQAHLLAVQEILQSQSSDNIALTQNSILVVADITQSQSIDRISWIAVVTPAGRIYAINAENRVYSIN